MKYVTRILNCGVMVALSSPLVSAQAVGSSSLLLPIPILAPTGNSLAASVILGNTPATWTFQVNCLDASCKTNPAATATLGPSNYKFAYSAGVNTTAYSCPITGPATVTCDVTVANAQGTQRAMVPYNVSDLTASTLTNPGGQIVQNITITSGGAILPSSLLFQGAAPTTSGSSTPTMASSASSSASPGIMSTSASTASSTVAASSSALTMSSSSSSSSSSIATSASSIAATSQAATATTAVSNSGGTESACRIHWLWMLAMTSIWGLWLY